VTSAYTTRAVRRHCLHPLAAPRSHASADASRVLAICLCVRARVSRLPPFPLQKDNMVFMDLDSENKAQIIASMWRSEVKAGVAAVKQGDLGDCLYVIAAGEFDVFVNEKKVAVRGKGTMFSELALMYNSPRAATVTANQDSIVWSVHVCGVRPRVTCFAW
jgi:CRP-like cAMP-binding protein